MLLSNIHKENLRYTKIDGMTLPYIELAMGDGKFIVVFFSSVRNISYFINRIDNTVLMLMKSYELFNNEIMPL